MEGHSVTFEAWEVAAYLMDRADQYETDSPCWVALSDAAHNIMDGYARGAVDAGELDDLRARVERWRKGSERKVVPDAGVER